jgi:hypothetical protein
VRLHQPNVLIAKAGDGENWHDDEGGVSILLDGTREGEVRIMSRQGEINSAFLFQLAFRTFHERKSNIDPRPSPKLAFDTDVPTSLYRPFTTKIMLPLDELFSSLLVCSVHSRPPARDKTVGALI